MTRTSRRRHRPGRSPRSSSRARCASRPAGTSSTAASRRPTSTCCPRRRQRLRLGDPYREDVDLGPIVNQKQLERVDGIVRRSVDAGARVVVGGDARGPVLPPDRPDRRHRRPRGLARGDLRAGRAGRRVRHRRRGARARQRQRVRAHRRRLLELDLARARARAALPVGHGPRQRPDRERRGHDPVRRAWARPATGRGSVAPRTGTSSPSGNG